VYILLISFNCISTFSLLKMIMQGELCRLACWSARKSRGRAKYFGLL